MRVATDLLDSDVVDFEDDAPESAADDASGASAPPSKKPASPVWRATQLGLAVVVALAVLVGWLGFRAYQSDQGQADRSQFLHAARQTALNLTTIDWQKVDSDVQRILDGATGEFHDDFAKRSQPFIDVVKQSRSTAVGTITEAGLESETAGTALVLVAVTVKTSNAGAPEQDPRAWRMRISVRQVGDQAKVSNVEFVP
ncbi:MAG: Mce-associated rane protein [Mycobacterium sp.]|jgi:Mce-associated membrane protein|nr:Mce-associated rane protein [Mycobacterium sp.]